MIDFAPDELPADLDAGEREELGRTASLLLAARPVPAPGFRGALRREVLGRAGRLAARPPRLRRRVAALLVTGTALVLVAASGLTGRGPLAPPADRAGQVAQVR